MRRLEVEAGTANADFSKHQIFCTDQSCKKQILEGEEVCRSPTHPSAFYHMACFRKMAKRMGTSMVDVPFDGVQTN